MTVFNDTFDTATPAGGDDPAEADDRMQEIKGAVQERENVDHYWPLTGTEVSDSATGEHRKVTLRTGDAPSKVADKGFVYVKDVSNKAELFYIDEDGTEIQITSGGKILSASLNSKDEDDMSSDSATHTSTQQSIKKYVDDFAALLPSGLSGDSDSDSDSPITIGNFKISWGISGSINNSLNVAHGLTKCFAALAVRNEASGGNLRGTIGVSAIDDTNITLENNDTTDTTARWFAIGR